MNTHSISFHTQGCLVLDVRHAPGTSTYWIEVKDQERAVVPCFFSDLPEHILIDACEAFNRVISEAMEGVDETDHL